MRRFDPAKLHVEYRPGATPAEPIIGRKYTLTHSDVTADLYLAIGLEYAYDKVNRMRDEVLAEWKMSTDIILLGSVLVDGRLGPLMSAIRNAVFKREMHLALEAIRQGDGRFFAAHPELDDAPIWIKFRSEDPRLDRLEYWGTPEKYKQPGRRA